MQRDRFLEELTAKYWNASLKGECNDLDENEGITLESLGENQSTKTGLNFKIVLYISFLQYLFTRKIWMKLA